MAGDSPENMIQKLKTSVCRQIAINQRLNEKNGILVFLEIVIQKLMNIWMLLKAKTPPTSVINIMVPHHSIDIRRVHPLHAVGSRDHVAPVDDDPPAVDLVDIGIRH